MRFSEIPVSTDLTDSPAVEPRSEEPNQETVVGRGNPEAPEKVERKSKDDSDQKGTGAERERAGRLIEHIGTEFDRLRKVGRSTAWASFRNLVAKNGSLLIMTGTVTFDQWVKTLKEIDGELAKGDGGSNESPGDVLATWLTEEDKPKRAKKAKAEVTQ